MRVFFSHSTIFFASSLILLSLKRAMRQLCSLCSHNAQPLETGRQPLDAVGRVFFFLSSELCVNYVRFAHIMRSRLRRVAICWRRWTFVLFPCTIFCFYLRFFFRSCFTKTISRYTSVSGRAGTPVTSEWAGMEVKTPPPHQCGYAHQFANALPRLLGRPSAHSRQHGCCPQCRIVP